MPDLSTTNTNAIELDNVSICYKLYNNPQDRLREALHPFKRKYHRQFYAVKDLSLVVPKGQILGIVGRNGAGKSTLLKLVCGVLQPTSGTVVTNGQISALLEISSGLNPEFTGIENIHLSGAIMGFTRKEMDARLPEILAFAGIGDFVNQPLKIFSSGMKARLAFAVAVNIDSEILILDEVLAVGDELFKRKCYARMEQLFKSGCTVLFVSHSVNNVNEICSRAILLDSGELLLEGTPKMVTTYYQRLLFAEPRNAADVRNEIIALNKSEERKSIFDLNIREVEHKAAGHDETELSVQQEFYIPDFEPTSTVSYRYHDVDIYDACIKTLGGKTVNALLLDQLYILTHKAKFRIDAENVCFSMKIKTEKGQNIAGAASNRMGRGIEVFEGDEYILEWQFHCSLLPKNYFVNVGVFQVVNGEIVGLNAVSDVIAFKVQRTPDLFYDGLVHLDQKLKIRKIG